MFWDSLFIHLLISGTEPGNSQNWSFIMKTVLSLLFTFLAFSPISFADDIPARTQDGKDVILHEDGTWEFAEFADPFEVKGTEQAEEFVKHMQCSRGGTIDQYLTNKAEIPSIEDLGWFLLKDIFNG